MRPYLRLMLGRLLWRLANKILRVLRGGLSVFSNSINMLKYPHRSRRKGLNVFSFFVAPTFSSILVAQELAPRVLMALDGPKGCFWGLVVCGDDLSLTAKTGKQKPWGHRGL